MKDISLDSIATNTPIDFYLCHKSGEILHKPGDIITDVHLALLKECSITSLISMESSADPKTFVQEFTKKSVSLGSVPVDEPVPATLYDEKGNTVAECGSTLSHDHMEMLAANGTTFLFYNKDAMELQRFQVEKYRTMLDSDKFESFSILPETATATAPPSSSEKPEETLEEETVAQNTSAAIPEDRFFIHPAKMITNTACKDMMQIPEMLSLPTFELSGYKKPARIINGRTRETALEYNNRYNEWTAALEPLFANLKGNKETPFERIDAIACGIIDLYLKDANYCCNLLNYRHPPTSERYLTTHSVNAGITAAGIGISLGFPLWLTRELVVGALLHDVGHLMTYRPSLAQKDFSSSEQQKYDNHAVVGMAMLKNITQIPISTMMVVAQHHEKLDGSGRIFHAAASRIHELAKIVAVIDAFETRCRFMNASAALANVITEAQNGKLDLQYAKAMVIQLSLYPIGTAVRTSKGMVCKVIGTNQQEFRKPLLRSLYSMQDGHLFPIDKTAIVDMKKSSVTIVEEITHSALKSDIAGGFYEP